MPTNIPINTTFNPVSRSALPGAQPDDRAAGGDQRERLQTQILQRLADRLDAAGGGRGAPAAGEASGGQDTLMKKIEELIELIKQLVTQRANGAADAETSATPQ